LHGINPGEAPKFLKAAGKLECFSNIRPVVLTFGDSIFGERRKNIRTIYPPTYTARDIELPVRQKTVDDVLTIGFFGQYRREKRLEDFLEVFVKGNYTRKVLLKVQGATMHPEDAEDFERIIRKYKDHTNMTFLHKGLIGAEWQKALANIDVLLLPYSAARYRYHWGGMLFTAIGFQKPVIASDDMNPEVFEQFHIGELFKSGDLNALQSTLEDFINHYDEKATVYADELAKASREYAPEAFASRIEKIIQE
jgi:glycosyltransferase involved in cell wall biosynthesis